MDTTQNCINSNAQTSARLCINDPDNQQGRDVITTGFQVGVGGWKFGGAFQYDDEGQERESANYEGVVGVTYGAGPWTVGAQGAYSADEDGAGDTDTIIAGEIGGAYTLGPGVTIGAAVQGWHGSGDDGNENFDGVVFTMGTALSF